MTESQKSPTVKREVQSHQSSVATQITQKSNLWIPLAVGAAFVYSLGNVAFGLGCSEYGLTGAGLPGPSALFVVLIYRLVQAILTKNRVGSFVDYANSHWWVLESSDRSAQVGTNDEDFQTAPSETSVATDPKYRFHWSNLGLVTLTQALPAQLSLICVCFAFKFALMASMNQGTIPSLFSVTSIYIGVLFYFCFGERLSISKMLGIALMVPCVIIISLDQKDEAESTQGYSVEQQKRFGLLAVMFALTAPFGWVLKAYFIRYTKEQGKYAIWDLSIDALIMQYTLGCLLLIPHYMMYPFEGKHLLAGLITGLFFVMGGIALMNAFSLGPGGPVNALVCTQIIYQMIINALFFGQGLSAYEIGGACFGIAATLLITLGEQCFKRCFGKREAATPPSNQRLLNKDIQSED